MRAYTKTVSPQKGEQMLAENKRKNINFVRIVSVLKSLREEGSITREEYYRAKTFYQKLTGADIIVVD